MSRAGCALVCLVAFARSRICGHLSLTGAGCDQPWKIAGAELPKWAVAAVLKPMVINDILWFGTKKDDGEKPDQIFMPRVIRVPFSLCGL